MCGLVGFSGAQPLDPVKLSFLLYYNEGRGTHSTGIYSNRHLVKDAVPASEFVLKDDYRDVLVDSKLALAHTRFATMGEKNAENAHPFKIGSGRGQIIGTHNGWLFDTMLEDYADKYDLPVPPVDSMLIFQVLYKTKDIKSINTLGGAMALAWVKNQKLYLYRRGSKPLFFGKTPEGYYYSSLKYPLELINCSQIGFMKRNEVYVVEEGAVTEVIPMGEDDYVPSLPLDASPHGWRYDVPKIEADRVEYQSKTNRNKKQTWEEQPTKKKRHKVKHMRLRDIGFERRDDWDDDWEEGENYYANKSPFKADFSGVAQEGLEVKKKLFMRSLPSKRHFLAQYKESDYLDWEDGDKHCYLLIQLKDSRSGQPVQYFPLFVDSDVDVPAVATNIDGYAVIKVKPVTPELDRIRLLTKDPLTDEVYYSVEITVKQSRVLEVALSVPFRNEEEAKTIDEGARDIRQHTTFVDKDGVLCPTVSLRKGQHDIRTEETSVGDSPGYEDTDSDRAPANERGDSDDVVVDAETDYGLGYNRDEEAEAREHAFLIGFQQTLDRDRDAKYASMGKPVEQYIQAHNTHSELDNTVYLEMSYQHINGRTLDSKVAQLKSKLDAVDELIILASKGMDVGADDKDIRRVVASCYSYLAEEREDIRDFITEVEGESDYEVFN